MKLKFYQPFQTLELIFISPFSPDHPSNTTRKLGIYWALIFQQTFINKPQSSRVYYPFWSDSALKFKQNVINKVVTYRGQLLLQKVQFGWLWLGELYNDIVAFPESSEENLEQYIWHPCASPIKLISNSNISMYYYEGGGYLLSKI